MPRWIYEDYNFNTLNLSFKNAITAVKLKCCGMEDQKNYYMAWKGKMLWPMADCLPPRKPFLFQT